MAHKATNKSFKTTKIFLDLTNEGRNLTLICKGEWTICQLEFVVDQLEHINKKNFFQIIIDTSQINILDISGAWLLSQYQQKLNARLLNENKKFSQLFSLIQNLKKNRSLNKTNNFSLTSILEDVGKSLFSFYKQSCHLLDFLGHIFVSLGRSIRQPKTFKWRAFLYHVEHVGIHALPIIGLTTLLIGIVLAYMGAIQLRKFGAEIYTLDLVAISILREIAIILTAVMIAGRSGSAFTAQIGTMKMNEEIDALTAMGIRPMRSLILPRIAAMVFVLPLVTFYADIMGLIGGGLMASLYLDTPLSQIVSHFQLAISKWHFWTGLIKAPLFGFVIGMISCYHGLSVQHNAESIGQHTTRSVVESIFLVIILDAFFAVFYGELGI